MKITPKQSRAAYQLGLSRFDGELGIAECKKRLAATGITLGSGTILIYIVSHLLRGEVFKRAFSAPTADSYLSWIREDRKAPAHALAVASLGKFIDYYEKKFGVRLHTMRKVHENHKSVQEPKNVSGARFSGSTQPSVVVRWIDVSARDVLPLEWFEDDTELLGVVHEMRNSRGSPCGAAKCDVRKDGKVATIDYRSYIDFNTDPKNDAELGIAHIIFLDYERAHPIHIDWEDEQGEKVGTGTPDLSFELPPAPPYVQPIDAAPKAPQMVRPRPGQALFGITMRQAYGNRCCMSGCDVTEVLEAAHIDPYRAPASNNAKNGLMLRSDLHTLFDKNLIAIEPHRLRLHVAVRARGNSSYVKLHERKLRAPTHQSYSPDPAALLRRWEAFKSANG